MSSASHGSATLGVQTYALGGGTTMAPRQAQEAPGRSQDGEPSNRREYRDLGLVFAKPSGAPLQSNNLGQREFAKLIELAGVKAITLHGLRHTSATLALKAGTLDPTDSFPWFETSAVISNAFSAALCFVPPLCDAPR